MIDPRVTEKLQRRAIGDPRLHVIVRDDWPRHPAPWWPELLLLGAIALAVALAW